MTEPKAVSSQPDKAVEPALPQPEVQRADELSMECSESIQALAEPKYDMSDNGV